MISNIEKIIREKLEERYKLSGKNLSFLKYSTSISGTGLGNKVIFFVFDDYSSNPFLIAKTVRTYRDAEVIRKGHLRLKLINTLTADSIFSKMFPEALLFSDDGNEIWNVETACFGNHANKHKDSEHILRDYVSFSEYLAKNSIEKINLEVNYGKKIIDEFVGSREMIDGLNNYNTKLWGNSLLELPKLPQHGDFTIDNILINEEGIKVIDCDIFGDVNIPGYDVFHFMVRSKLPNIKEKLNRLFKSLNISSVPDKKLLFVYYLHELYVKKDYILIGQNSSYIIEKFENMLLSYRV